MALVERLALWLVLFGVDEIGVDGEIKYNKKRLRTLLFTVGLGLSASVDTYRRRPRSVVGVVGFLVSAFVAIFGALVLAPWVWWVQPRLRGGK